MHGFANLKGRGLMQSSSPCPVAARRSRTTDSCCATSRPTPRRPRAFRHVHAISPNIWQRSTYRKQLLRCRSRSPTMPLARFSTAKRSSASRKTSSPRLVSSSRMCRKGIYAAVRRAPRSEEHTSELQSHVNLVCRLLLVKKKVSLHHTLVQLLLVLLYLVDELIGPAFIEVHI